MKKRAFNPMDTWQSMRENPLVGGAMSVGSFVPGVGGAIAAGDMVNNLYRGNLATAGLNAVQTAAGFVPGGKLVSHLASKGRLGNVASKVLPYVAPMAASPPTMLQHVGSLVPTIAAQGVDQYRASNRPAVQKAMRDQEATMREFNEWRQHKSALQNMSAQQPQAPQVKESAAPPTVGEMGGKLWGHAQTAMPYVYPAMYAGHMMPSYLKDDVGGMIRGVATGTGAGLGMTGGFMGGGLIGSALAQMLAAKYGKDPRMAANVGAGIGGTIGGLAGHWGSRRMTDQLIDDNGESPVNLRGLMRKYSSTLIKSSANKSESAHDKSRFEMRAKQIASQGGNIQEGRLPLSKKQMEQAMRGRRGKASAPKAEAPAASIDPAAAAMTGAAPGAPATGAGVKPVDVSSFKRKAEGGPSWHQRLTSEQTPSTRLGMGAFKPDAGLAGPETFAAPARGPIDYLRQMQNHPMYHSATRFATSPAGIATGVGALGIAGAGAYLMGRRKRNQEDAVATQEMALPGVNG
jgi:hypothetical protein